VNLRLKFEAELRIIKPKKIKINSGYDVSLSLSKTIEQVTLRQAQCDKLQLISCKNKPLWTLSPSFGLAD
jgi:hypothetical protein